jgi:predicted Fe-S protein YdhL (DUF1289 family)
MIKSFIIAIAVLMGIGCFTGCKRTVEEKSEYRQNSDGTQTKRHKEVKTDDRGGYQKTETKETNQR